MRGYRGSQHAWAKTMLNGYPDALLLVSGLVTFMAARWRGIWGIVGAQCVVAVAILVCDFCFLASFPDRDFDGVFAVFFPVRVLILTVAANVILSPVAAVGYYAYRRRQRTAGAIAAAERT
jgi:hypothetical protein